MDDSIYRLRHRDILTLCVLGLLGLGVVMVQSAAMNVSGDPRWQWTERGMRHLVYAMAAAITYFVVGQLDYRMLARRARTAWHSPIVLLYVLAAFSCLIVLIPHVGIEVNGARRWLPLGFVQVQPSELGKWGVVILLAWMLTQMGENVRAFWRGLVPVLVPVGAICLLVVIQDFGTAVLIAACSLTILLAGRVRLWHILILVPPALAAALAFVMSEPYRWSRMTSFLDPWASPRGEGYHMVQSLLSFATGGVTGRGLGNGVQKLGYLPEDTTDFIFAVICEELGLFGAALTMTLYLGIIYVAWQAVRHKAEPFGRLLAYGIASMVGLQAMINVAVATVSVPTKGLSLPLVSAGGSGLIITCGALGLLYSVLRTEDEPTGAAYADALADGPATVDIQPLRQTSIEAGFPLTPEAHRA